MLIVDMKMPKRCFDCPMHDWTYGQPRQRVLVCNAHHELTPIPNGDERPEWCPIKGELSVKHGTWIPKNNPFTGNCSECGSESNMKDNYCPNCGARMDGERNLHELARTYTRASGKDGERDGET